MNTEIKERIEMINKGEVPEGYKKTKVGIIPEDWEVKRLGEMVKFLDDKRVPIKEEDRRHMKKLYPYYGASGIIDYVDDYLFNEELILLGEDGANILTRSSRLAFLVSGKYWVNNHAHVMKGKECINQYFLAEKLESLSYKKYNTGTAQPKINQKTCSNIEIAIPFLQEQQKIAQILSTWDQAIELKEKLIEEKKEQKKGLMQKLLTGEVRLPGFDGEVIKTRLKGYVKEVKRKNIKGETNKILSVTNAHGFVEQHEQFDKRVASQDLNGYKIIRKGEFAYNPSRVNVGSIDLLRSYKVGVLSPMYVVFKTENEKLLSEYLYQYVKSNEFYEQMKGLLQGSVRKSLNFDAFEMIKLFVPKTLQEQKSIAQILSTADKEIDLLTQELEQLKLQKKGLMQLLLTGIIRVKS